MKKHGTIWQPEDLLVQKNKNQDGSIGYLSEPMLPFCILLLAGCDVGERRMEIMIESE